MLRNVVLILSLLVSGPLYASEACSGSTEEQLQCYSGEVKDFLRRWVKTAWTEQWTDKLSTETAYTYRD